MLNTGFSNDVRQTLDHFRRTVDQMFDNYYQTQSPNGNSTLDRPWTFSPAVEYAWSDKSLNLRAVLPGVSENDMHVSVQNNHLVIEGERKAPEGFDKNAFTQLAYGKFHTTLALPSGLDVEHLKCRLNNGVLDIEAPISEASKPKQIRIEKGSDQKAISA